MDGITPQVEARDCRTDVEEMLAEHDLLGALPSAIRWGEGEPAFAGLVRTIETEVIPRLMLAHRGVPGSRQAAAEGGIAPTAGEVVELTRLVLAHDAEVATSFAVALREQGSGVEALYLDLLAPSARRLGEMWEDDLCSFTDVTVGLWRLQQVAHALRGNYPDEDEPAGGRRILLVAMPGEQHTFGLSLVAEFFRRAGWSVRNEPLPTGRDLLTLVRGTWFSVVGLSASSDTKLDGLAALMLAVRRVSRNRAVRLMVGGPVFVDHPELVAQLGADASAADGKQAVAQAQNLLDLLARPG